MNYLLKIIGTNWIHIVGFYITTYLTLVIFKAFGIEEQYTWAQVFLMSIVSIPFLFFTYGLFIILSFIASIMVLDIAGFTWNNQNIRMTLLTEWLIISPIFIYWAFEYEYWLWLSLTISFLATQLLRQRTIERAIKQRRNSR